MRKPAVLKFSAERRNIDFISKYGVKSIRTRNISRRLYQLYGDKEGFFDWVEQMEIPGDTKGTTYLELLYEIHPELKPTTFKKMGMPDDELIRRTATGGGATPPHSQSFWWLNQGMTKK